MGAERHAIQPFCPIAILIFPLKGKEWFCGMQVIFRLTECHESLTLRSPLKVAAPDDHNVTVQGLHPTRAAGMLPSHAVQVATLE